MQKKSTPREGPVSQHTDIEPINIDDYLSWLDDVLQFIFQRPPNIEKCGGKYEV